METKKNKKVQSSEPKSVKVIQSIIKEKGYDLHKVINETKTDVTVAFGYKKHNHSILIKHNFSNKTNETIKVNGEVSFKEFVIGLIPVETIEVVENSEVKA